MQDPIGALQSLARQQGTGNNQVMGMAGAGPNNPQGMVPQQPPQNNTATNCNLPTDLQNLKLSD